ncbi:MAG: GTP-binding protein [Thiotrichales bacterium]
MSANHKIVFTGPVSSGKTTAIAAVSDAMPVQTEARASDRTRYLKSHTTVAMDYGVMDLGEGEKLHLYGTPGQERFEFMWDILTEGVLGMVILIDDSDEDPMRRLLQYLTAFDEVLRESRFVVAVTKTDLTGTATLNHYHQKLEQYGYHAPVLEVDARSGSDVAVLLQCLLYSIDPGISVVQDGASNVGR